MSRALERAAVQEHLGEAHVVAGGRHAAAAATFELRRLRGIEQLDLLVRVGIDRQRLREARLPVGGDDETRVGHLERTEDALGENLAERLARHDFDDAPENIGREAVLPRRTRLIQERQLGEPRDELLRRELACEPGHSALVELVDLRRAAVAVGEAGRVAQQILDRHLGRRRHRVEHGLAGGRIELLHADLAIGELRDVLRDGIREQEPAFFVEHHRRDGHERLGHRRDAEDRVGRHRRVRALVAEADGVEVRDTPLARHHHDGAGDAATLDVGAQDLPDAVESLGRESDVVRFRARSGSGSAAAPTTRSSEKPTTSESASAFMMRLLC